jgi:Zn-dependent peptidase ImmA (M78 family)/DNA-binding transcriptional regulator YiaG
MSRKLRTSSSRSSDGVHKSARTFNHTRLTLARKRRGLTKIEFSRRMGVSLRSFEAYELGEYPPNKNATSKIAAVSGFPSEFFFGDDLDEPMSDTASFRSMARMKSSQREMALSQGAIAMHLNNWLEDRFELPQCEVPNLRDQSSPESAAEALRHHWGIGELPINNVIHLLEAKGVRIFSLAIDAREVDAFSLWKESTPFIFLNNNKTSEHSRFDAAHELGHLVLHRHGGPRGREAECEANAFASAFLMPRASVIAHSPRFPTLRTLVKLKRIWKTSVAALCYRLHAVGMLSEWQYRMLYIQISKNGFRTAEPNEAPRETSQVLPKIFTLLQKEGMTRPRVARDLSIPQSELECLMFGLTITSLDGGRKGTPTRSNLTLVNKS